MFSVRFRFLYRFDLYVKALIGFKAFYFSVHFWFSFMAFKLIMTLLGSLTMWRYQHFSSKFFWNFIVSLVYTVIKLSAFMVGVTASLTWRLLKLKIYRFIFHSCVIEPGLNDNLYLSSSQETLSYRFCKQEQKQGLTKSV